MLLTVSAGRAENCEGVAIRAGTEIQDVVATHAPGTTYCIASGLYRLTKAIVPKSGDKLIAAPGAVLNGAKRIDDWKSQGNVWVAVGQSQRSEPSWKPNWPEIADPAAQYNEDLFIDNKPLQRVLSRAEVGPGEFFFDYDNSSIYIGDNPHGHTVECGATQIAIDGRAGNIEVKGFIVEKYTVAGISAGTAGLVEDNEVRYVHGSGIRFNSRARILHNHVHHNGKYGMNGSGEDALLEGNELSYNNAAGYRTKGSGGCWDAGATKFVYSNRLVVRRNYSHDNYCDGFWSDIDNINTIYENNRIENNWRHGIFLEIGYKATVRNNHIKGNRAAGIYLNSTGGQDIYGNTIEDNGVGTSGWLPILDVTRGGILIIQQNRGTGRYGERLSKNNRVHDNTIRMTVGTSGPTQRQGSPKVFEQDNVFSGNHYFVPDPAGSWWSWQGGPKTWIEWRAAGQDKDGTVERITAR